MSVSELECIKIILLKFPGFRIHWLAALDDWGDPSAPTGDLLELTDFDHYANKLPGMGLDLSEFANYVISLIKQGSVEDLYLYEIFIFIEFLMLNGSDDVKNAAATGFLETLLHAVPEKIKATTFTSYLGKESKAYCKAWDEFTGVKTEGL